MFVVNRRFLSEIKATISSTTFSPSDFEIIPSPDPDNKNLVLRIVFKYDDAYWFNLYHSFPDLESGTTNVEFSPGEYSLYVNETPAHFKYSPRHVLKWCNFLHQELVSISSTESSPVERLREQLDAQISESIGDDAHDIASAEELLNLKTKFDAILSEFQKLQEKNEVTDELVAELKEELDRLKESAETMPKGIWAKIAKNKLVDWGASIANSKEGKALAIEAIKRTLLP